MNDAHLAALLNAPRDANAHELVVRYAPLIRFDSREPFLPLAAGYTIFYDDGTSSSFRQGHKIELQPAGKVPAELGIEFAIWWDWDIGHLYELEHIWIFIDAAGRVVRGEASWHGDQHDMQLDGRLWLEGDHLVVFSEPGKHAFAPTPDWFRERQQEFKRSETCDLAGVGGVLVTRYIQDRVRKTPFNDLLVRSYLAQQAFEPSWTFDHIFRFTPEMLVPWPALQAWMPGRVNHWLDKLRHMVEPAQYRFWRIGHRGARAYEPDNTLRSFRKAADLGADIVELDVQCTADDQVVVIHDTCLIGPDNHILQVRKSTLAELQAIDLGAGERVPTLSEALQVCEQENMGAYIEIKDGATIPAVVKAIEKYEHCIVGSFRPDWLADIKSLASQTPTSILFSSSHLDAVMLAQSIGADYVHPCWERFDHPSSLLTTEWLENVRKAALGIICWHEERPEEIASLRQAGVDGICSDAPELLL
ncbi:MAG: glycerophosphodiester phosphodiesterase [Anaerolineae bacterium]|nr:glycerophosphodiester phosphodiesterase [Anaerolineae bacterium]